MELFNDGDIKTQGHKDDSKEVNLGVLVLSCFYILIMTYQQVQIATVLCDGVDIDDGCAFCISAIVTNLHLVATW